MPDGSKESPKPPWNLLLDEAELAMLGYIVSLWTGVERYVDQMLTWLHGVDGQQYRTLYERAQIGTKLKHLGQVADRVYDPRHTPRIRSLVAKLQNINGERNILVHGLWSTKIERVGGRISLGQEPYAQMHQKDAISVNRLPIVAEQMTIAATELDDLWTEMTNAPARPPEGRIHSIGDFLTPEQAQAMRKSPTRPTAPPAKHSLTFQLGPPIGMAIRRDDRGATKADDQTQA